MSGEDAAAANKPPRAQWKHTTRFPIQDRMIDVILKTKTASEAQLEHYRKKLRKMQLGS